MPPRAWKVLPAIAALLLAACDLTTRAPGYETSTMHADGSPVTAEEKAEALSRHKSECQRLYGMLGDRSLTAQQIEAIRVSMNAKLCAGLVP
jgi:hypothetical protein